MTDSLAKIDYKSILFGAFKEAVKIFYFFIIMDREHSYSTLPAMYEKGQIQSLFDIFKYVRRTPLALDIGMRVDRLNKYMKRVETFKMEDIIRMGERCNLSLEVMMDLWRKEYEIQKEVRKRR